MLLDGCLVNCHMQQRSAEAEGHCHQAAHSDATQSWQEASTCDHDHDGPSAEAVFQTRSDAPLKMSGLALAPDAIEITGARDFVDWNNVAPRAHRPLFSPAFITPQRV